MALNVEQFVSEIESMSVLELNNLVKSLEEKFGVSAAAMAMPAAAGAPAAGAAAPAEEEKTEFTVVLAAAGDNEGVSKDDAANMKKKFEEVGAKVEIK
jgi:large subunit ribosomal protein L7/L12